MTILRPIGTGFEEDPFEATLGPVLSRTTRAGLEVVVYGCDEPSRRPPLPSSDTAYIVPTSGSTGAPKGVAVSRASLEAYTQWYVDRFALVPTDVAGLTCAVAFDLVINSLIPPTIAKCTIAIPDDDVMLSPQRMVAFLRDASVSILNLTPSLGRIVAEGWRRVGAPALEEVSRVIFCGEKLPTATATAWRDLAPNARLYNCYGVAEATVISTCHEIVPEDLNGGFLPIGAPISGMSLEVGSSGEDGVGELVLRGPLVAEGYVGLLAAEHSSRFGPVDGGDDRSYRTGDLVRRNSAGNLFVLGRRDRQTKVAGGFRVDPGEVEEALLGSGHGFTEVAVVPVDQGDEVRLAGFYTARTPVCSDELTAWMRLHLPRHQFVHPLRQLPVLPTTSNGKIDYETLRDRVWDSQDREAGSQERSGSVRGVLERAWRLALGAEVDLPDDADFFAIGGSSLRLISMITELELVLGVVVQPSRLLKQSRFFEHLSLVQEAVREQARTVRESFIEPENAQGEPKRAAARARRDNWKKPHASSRVAVVAASVRLPHTNSFEELDVLFGGQPPPLASAELFRARFPDATELCSGHFFTVPQVAALVEALGDRGAAHTDPQQALWHRVGEEALENLPPQVFEEAVIAVFAGVGPTFFATRTAGVGDARLLGTTPSLAAGRLAYRHDLRGPNLVIESACSSSLVAVHTAARAIIGHEAELALAGGAQLFSDPLSFAQLREAGILSPTSCTPFDRAADGYVVGEGAGAVLLASEEAVARWRLPVIAWVLGSHVNHGGRAATITSPNPAQHSSLYRGALAAARVAEHKVAFVEAHGTGTALGDPVEAHGLHEVFRDRAHPLLVGAGKGHCGHLHYAAGILGLLKAIRQLAKGTVFPIAGLSVLNPRIRGYTPPLRFALEQARLEVAAVGLVSSFGIGGTNCAVAVQGPDPFARPENNTSPARHAASAPDSSQEAPAGDPTTEPDMMLSTIKNTIARHLSVEPTAIGSDLSPVEAGLDSLGCLEIVEQLQDELGREVRLGDFLDGSTIREIAFRISDPSKVEPTDATRAAIPANGTPGAGELVTTLLSHFRFELSMLLTNTPRPLDRWYSEAVIELLHRHHDLLRLALREPRRPQPSSPAIGRVAEVHTIVARLLDLPEALVGPKDSFTQDLGIDSLTRLRILTEVHKTLGGSGALPEALVVADSVAELANALEGLSR